MAPKKRRAVKRQVWNKGLVIGKRDGLTPAQVKRIRGLLDDRGAAGIRELALFTTAIDTMLHGHDLVRLAGRAEPRWFTPLGHKGQADTGSTTGAVRLVQGSGEGTRKMDRSVRQEAHRLPVL